MKLNAESLRREIARRGLDQQRFAKAARISAATLSSAINGNPVKPRTLHRIIDTLTRLDVVDTYALVS